LNNPAGIKPNTEKFATVAAPTTFGELMQTLDIVPGKLQIPQGTSKSGSSHIKLGSGKPQS